MPHRKDIKGVLFNFLGTYTSRYSDYEGYWLFSMFVGDVSNLHVDLLRPKNELEVLAPVRFATQLAAKKFAEQIDKAGFSLSAIREASLEITRSLKTRDFAEFGPSRTGYDLRFVANVVFHDGKKYDKDVSIFVAPHNPEIDLRSARFISS